MGTLNYGYGLSLCLARLHTAQASALIIGNNIHGAVDGFKLDDKKSRDCFHSVTGARQTACCV
jgi:hypothetical protein